MPIINPSNVERVIVKKKGETSTSEAQQILGTDGSVTWCHPYKVTVNTSATGIKAITITRTATSEPTASTGVIENNSTIYYGDTITINAIPSTGYNITGGTGTHSPVTGNISVAIETEAIKYHCTVTKGTGVASAVAYRNSELITPLTDLYQGDVITIDAHASNGYTMDSYTKSYTVNGADISVSVTAHLLGYTLTKSVTNPAYGTYTITRIDSSIGGAALGELDNGAKIFRGDKLTATAVANSPTYGNWDLNSLTKPTVEDYGGKRSSAAVKVTNLNSVTVNVDGSHVYVDLASGASHDFTGLSFSTAYSYYLWSYSHRNVTNYDRVRADIHSSSKPYIVTGNATLSAEFDSSGKTESKVVISDSVSITTSAQSKFTVSVSGSHLTYTGTGSFNYGGSTTVVITADAGYYFESYSSGAEVLQTRYIWTSKTAVTSYATQIRYTVSNITSDVSYSVTSHGYVVYNCVNGAYSYIDLSSKDVSCGATVSFDWHIQSNDPYSYSSSTEQSTLNKATTTTVTAPSSIDSSTTYTVNAPTAYGPYYQCTINSATNMTHSYTSGNYLKNGTVVYYYCNSNYSTSSATQQASLSTTYTSGTVSSSKTSFSGCTVYGPYYKTTLSGTNCSANYTSGYYIKNGTTITWTANTRYSFNSAENQSSLTTTTTTTVGSSGSSSATAYGYFYYITLSKTNCSGTTGCYVLSGKSLSFTITASSNYYMSSWDAGSVVSSSSIGDVFQYYNSSQGCSNPTRYSQVSGTISSVSADKTYLFSASRYYIIYAAAYYNSTYITSTYWVRADAGANMSSLYASWVYGETYTISSGVSRYAGWARNDQAPSNMTQDVTVVRTYNVIQYYCTINQTTGTTTNYSTGWLDSGTTIIYETNDDYSWTSGDVRSRLDHGSSSAGSVSSSTTTFSCPASVYGPYYKWTLTANNSTLDSSASWILSGKSKTYTATASSRYSFSKSASLLSSSSGLGDTQAKSTGTVSAAGTLTWTPNGYYYYISSVSVGTNKYSNAASGYYALYGTTIYAYPNSNYSWSSSTQQSSLSTSEKSMGTVTADNQSFSNSTSVYGPYYKISLTFTNCSQSTSYTSGYYIKSGTSIKATATGRYGWSSPGDSQTQTSGSSNLTFSPSNYYYYWTINKGTGVASTNYSSGYYTSGTRSLTATASTGYYISGGTGNVSLTSDTTTNVTATIYTHTVTYNFSGYAGYGATAVVNNNGTVTYPTSSGSISNTYFNSWSISGGDPVYGSWGSYGSVSAPIVNADSSTWIQWKAQDSSGHLVVDGSYKTHLGAYETYTSYGLSAGSSHSAYIYARRNRSRYIYYTSTVSSGTFSSDKTVSIPVYRGVDFETNSQVASSTTTHTTQSAVGIPTLSAPTNYKIDNDSIADIYLTNPNSVTVNVYVNGSYSGTMAANASYWWSNGVVWGTNYIYFTASGYNNSEQISIYVYPSSC